jgi:hypothetical protein
VDLDDLGADLDGMGASLQGGGAALSGFSLGSGFAGRWLRQQGGRRGAAEAAHGRGQGQGEASPVTVHEARA